MSGWNPFGPKDGLGRLLNDIGDAGINASGDTAFARAAGIEPAKRTMAQRVDIEAGERRGLDPTDPDDVFNARYRRG